MFNGTEEELKQTRVTQPAIFLHSIALVLAAAEQFKPMMVAGHSLGEFSALATVGAMRWQDALLLVTKRANAMQKACEMQESFQKCIHNLSKNILILLS